MADWIEAGQTAPEFTAPDETGQLVSLSSLQGRPVVLYFYPKDDTPGCTKEACAFRDRKAEMDKLGAVVLGVSPDTSESHTEFRSKYDLNFTLLSDPEHKLADTYGAWREKNMYGKVSWGVARSTYLIGPDGTVVKVWKKVNVDGHDEQVLGELQKLPK